MITLLVGVSVLTVIGIVVALALGRGSSSEAGSAADVVRDYLDALAKGDAAAALALSAAEPASKTFLTDEVLDKQIAKWPITNIAVTDDPGSSQGGFAMVKTSADFGGKPSETELVVRKRDGVWKLDSAALNVTVASKHADKGPASTLTLFGEPVGRDGTTNVYVFPGYLGFGSSNPYFGVSVPPLLLDGLQGGDSAKYADIKYAVNDNGRAAVNKAVETWLSACLSAPERNYNCVDITTNTPMDRATARIEGPVDVSRLTQTLIPLSLSVTVAGEVHYTIAATTTDGRATTYDTKGPVNTTVDLSRQPPAVGPMR